MSKLTTILIAAILAFFATLSQADISTQFVKLSLSMRIPEGYDVTEWYAVLGKLSPACGAGNIGDKLIKEVAGERDFVVYQELPVDTTFEDFQVACNDAIYKNKEGLKSYGKVKLSTEEGVEQYQLITLPTECLTTCGSQLLGCPACPLLNVCTEDAQCGAFSKCVTSEKNKDEKWCISSNTTHLVTASALVAVVIALLF